MQQVQHDNKLKMKNTLYILAILFTTLVSAQKDTIKISMPAPQQITYDATTKKISLNGSTDIDISDLELQKAQLKDSLEALTGVDRLDSYSIKNLGFTPTEWEALSEADKLKYEGSPIYAEDGIINVSDGAITRSKLDTSLDGDITKLENKFVSNYTELRALTGMNDLDVVRVTDSGIAGDFVYSTLGSIIDNGGTIISGWYRQYDGVYLQPEWFGAVMDGVTDDRDIFIETLAYADTLNQRVKITKDIFLDVEETGTKSIFLYNDAWLEGSSKDVNIISNTHYSSLFSINLCENITLKNFTILHDNSYDAVTNEEDDTAVKNANSQQVEDWLIANRGLTFDTAVNPVWKGGGSYRALFFISGSKNITFDNVHIKAKGDNANEFLYWGIKFLEQYSANQNLTTEAGNDRTITEYIYIKNCSFDGVLMAMQGNVSNFYVDNLTSYRYSDFQHSDGTNVGGDGVTGVSPPHLFYLNTDGGTYYPYNINISNVYDYGEYVGSLDVRGSGGYCNSLKIVDGVSEVNVDNYKSFRRDGLGDLGGIDNGTFKNLYSESTTDIFDSSWAFNSLRFLTTMNNCYFDNIIIKDNSATSTIYPIDRITGDNNILNNVHVYMNDYSGTGDGLFGVYGNNNTILNTSLNLLDHTSTQTYRGVVFHNSSTISGGENNHYELTINGWRSIDSNPIALKMRMLFADETNENNNYSKVIDTDNNYIIEQVNEIEHDTWIRTETIDLTSETGTSVELTKYIESGFGIKSAKVVIVDELDAGVTAQLYSGANDEYLLVDNIDNSSGSINISYFDELSSSDVVDIRVYLTTSTGTFNSTGKVKVTLELTRRSLN